MSGNMTKAELIDEVSRVVEMTRRVVYDVLGERTDGPVTLRTWTFHGPAHVASDDERERARRCHQRSRRASGAADGGP